MSIAAVVMLTSILYIEKIIEEIPKHSIKHTLEIFLPIPVIGLPLHHWLPYRQPCWQL